MCDYISWFLDCHVGAEAKDLHVSFSKSLQQHLSLDSALPSDITGARVTCLSVRQALACGEARPGRRSPPQTMSWT